LDFPEAARQRPFRAAVKLLAVFDAEGQVAEVRATSMLPYGVPESLAGSGGFADRTPAMFDSKFVKELPYGLTEAAIEQVKGIRFSPKTVDGKSVSTEVIVLSDFSWTESRGSAGCSEVTLTVMDDSGVLWSDNTWARRHRGCRMI
jgi:hypothetical protein